MFKIIGMKTLFDYSDSITKLMYQLINSLFSIRTIAKLQEIAKKFTKRQNIGETEPQGRPDQSKTTQISSISSALKSYVII